MRRRPVLSVFSIVALCACAGAVPADAATLHGGGHTLRVQVRATDDGLAKLAVFNFRTHRCSASGVRFRDVASVRPDRVGPRFRVRGSYSFRERDYRVAVAVRASGRRVSIYRWRGAFAVTAVIRKGGRVLDRCVRGTTHWVASAPRAKFEMAGDEGDYISGGRSYSYASPAHSFIVGGNSKMVNVSVGPWNIEFKAPSGRRLKPGRFTGARRAPFSGRAAGLEISGDGRGCNELTGEFTVKRASFDRHGVRTFSVTFEQHCEGGDPALRGSFSFRR